MVGGVFFPSRTLARVCGRQEKNEKTRTEHERVQFRLRLNTRGLSYTHTARSKTHLETPPNASTRLTEGMT